MKKIGFMSIMIIMYTVNTYDRATIWDQENVTIIKIQLKYDF